MSHSAVTHCRKLPGTALGKLCDRCDGRCVICDSYFRPHEEVHICEECNYGSLGDECIVCGFKGASATAYYCKQCVLLQRDRDGCPKILNLNATKTDLFYERKKNPKNN